MYTSSSHMALTQKNPSFVTMWVVITMCIALLWLFRGPLTWNETSRIPVAKHFVDPTWIPDDWFLNTSTLYQIPFNLLAAPFFGFLDLGTATILLRLMLYAWFASGVVALARRLDIGLMPLIPAIMIAVAYRSRSLAADEWMVGHAEMKTVAYGAVLWAFSMLLGKRYRSAAAFLGLATSFHILVGLYATLTIILFVLSHQEHRQEMTKTLPISIPVYLVTGGFGLYVILHTVVSIGEGDRLIDLVYVARNRHHLWPPAWMAGTRLFLPYQVDKLVWVVNAAVSVSFLALISMTSRFRPMREFAHIALLSSLSFGIGLFAYCLGSVSLLKFYPFRFPDVLVPFAAFLLFFATWDRLATDSELYLLSPRVKRTLRIGLLAAVVLVMLGGSIKTISHLQIKWRADEPWPYVRLSSEEREAARWIRTNTPADANFLADPYFEAFYLTAERGALVFWKHIPSELDDLKEWYERLGAANGGREVLLDSLRIDQEQIQRSFEQMPFEYARKLAARYDLDYYFGPFREDWDIEPLFRAGNTAIYKLP